ncbi:MAG: c-type cytochrome domain-containing protein [Opitutae bacterium]
MKRLSILALIFSASGVLAADDPKVAARLATYTKEIKPMLDQSCIGCHGKDGKKPKAGFNATTLEGLEKGGKEEGKGITWGDAAKSSLYTLSYEGSTARDQEKAMPPKKSKSEPLTTEQLAKLKAWIEAK